MPLHPVGKGTNQYGLVKIDAENLLSEECGGWDLNPRRPTPEDFSGLPLKSSPLS